MKPTISDVVPICFATNDEYCIYAGVAIQSIIANASMKTKYEIHVIYSNLSTKHAMQLSEMSTLNVLITLHRSQQLISEQFHFLYSRAHYSKDMYLRWLIPNLFPSINKCIYLDCDTIIEVDIAELYRLDISGKSFGGVINFKTEKFRRHLEQDLGLDPREYINSGVLVMNCMKLRSVPFPDNCFAYVRQHRQLHCPDQDALNATFQKDIVILPPEWNVQWQHFWNKPDNPLIAPDDHSFCQAINDPKIIHFTTNVKPWNDSKRPFANRFWYYAKLSSFYSELIKPYANELNAISASGIK